MGVFPVALLPPTGDKGHFKGGGRRKCRFHARLLNYQAFFLACFQNDHIYFQAVQLKWLPHRWAGRANPFFHFWTGRSCSSTPRLTLRFKVITEKCSPSADEHENSVPASNSAQTCKRSNKQRNTFFEWRGTLMFMFRRWRVVICYVI